MRTVPLYLPNKTSTRDWLGPTTKQPMRVGIKKKKIPKNIMNPTASPPPEPDTRLASKIIVPGMAASGIHAEIGLNSDSVDGVFCIST